MDPLNGEPADGADVEPADSLAMLAAALLNLSPAEKAKLAAMLLSGNARDLRCTPAAAREATIGIASWAVNR